MTIEPSNLIKRKVLFYVPIALKIQDEEYVERGSVISVDTKRKNAMICFMYHGYKSETADIPFSHILAVYDKDGEHLVIDNFSGPSIDLRNKAPFGTHKPKKYA